jgi:tellurite resistance-related uncharacterized protein
MQPYKTTMVFDEATLPAALRRDHATKAGTWGLIRVLEGRLRLVFADASPEQLLTPDTPGRIAPEQRHRVEPLGPIRMQVEFYTADPG